MPDRANDSGNLLHRISSKLPYLPAALRQVADFILDKPEEIQSMSITTLAKRTGVAESTVSRFARELGLDGYQALRIGLAEASFINRSATRAKQAPFVYDGITRDDEVADIIGKIAHSSALSLEQTATRINADAVRAAVELIESSSVIVFSCMGSSSIAGEEGVMRFTRAGKKCLLFRDQSVQAMLATVVGPGDVVIAISDSGRSTPIVEVMRQARAHGAATIAITSAEDSPILAHSDVALFTSTTPTGGLLYGEAVTSKWGQIMVVDTLYATYAARHFDATVGHLEETYAAGIQHSRSSSTSG